MSLYKVLRSVVTLFVKICFRVKYIGVENIPSESGYIFCSNHISAFDPFFIACNNKTEFHFIAKEELVKIPVLGWLLKKINVIPVKRGTGDLGAMKKGIEVLSSGNSLIIFPEGTRSKTGEMGEAKNGMALLVKKTGCGIVPCAVIGKAGFLRKTKMVFGKPVKPGFFEGEKDLNVITSYVMESIKKLIEDNK